MTVFVEKQVWISNKIFNRPDLGEILGRCQDFSDIVDSSVNVINPGLNDSRKFKKKQNKGRRNQIVSVSYYLKIQTIIE